MNNLEFSKLLEKRTKDFSISIVRLSVSLPDTLELKIIRNQLIKSATSIGANYREANRSRSRADFKNRIRICQAEASETVYWLEIINETNIHLKYHIDPLMSDSKEFLALFTSILNKISK